ncbi:MAG: translation elongation factor EF-1beta [Candidatus Methanomethylophilaceae archaeon]|nr:translation elongation factor EF-1beta [Candidatus Methanomethylophilaceae archaeon]
MGQIYAVYELFPESTDVDLQGVIAKVPQVIPSAVKFNDADTKIAPVAFGLEKVVVAFIIDDSDETAGSKLEDALRNIEGIDNVECTQNTVL